MSEVQGGRSTGEHGADSGLTSACAPVIKVRHRTGEGQRNNKPESVNRGVTKGREGMHMVQ